MDLSCTQAKGEKRFGGCHPFRPFCSNCASRHHQHRRSTSYEGTDLFRLGGELRDVVRRHRPRILLLTFTGIDSYEEKLVLPKAPWRLGDRATGRQSRICTLTLMYLHVIAQSPYSLARMGPCPWRLLHACTLLVSRLYNSNVRVFLEEEPRLTRHTHAAYLTTEIHPSSACGHRLTRAGEPRTAQPTEARPNTCHYPCRSPTRPMPSRCRRGTRCAR